MHRQVVLYRDLNTASHLNFSTHVDLPEDFLLESSIKQKNLKKIKHLQCPIAT